MELRQQLEEALENRFALGLVLHIVEVVSSLDVAEHGGLRILVEREHLGHPNPFAMEHLQDLRFAARRIDARIGERFVAGAADVGLSRLPIDLEVDEPGEATPRFAALATPTQDAATEMLLHPGKDHLPTVLALVRHRVFSLARSSLTIPIRYTPPSERARRPASTARHISRATSRCRPRRSRYAARAPPF